jgi:hypothetical protein
VTAVVGLETPEGAWLGCDSFLGDDVAADALARPKLFRRPGLVFGWAGSVTAAQAVEHMPRFRARRRGEDPESYLVAVVVPRVRAALAPLGYPSTGRDAVASPADFLVAVGGRLWTLQDDLSAVRSAMGFAAIGAGAPYALGALAATDGAPAARVRRALEVATRLCAQVRAPYHFVRAA